MSKLLTISTRDKFALSFKGIILATFHVLEPKFAPIQIMENIKRAKEIERQLQAGIYPEPSLQAKFNAITNLN